MINQSQLISIGKLKNNSGQIEGLPKNPRLLKDDKFKKLVKSIKDDPEMLQLREVIAYELNNELIVIAGNMRLGACKEIGIKEIPVKILPQDTSVEKLKAYTIKDNLGYGEWSWDDIANEWDMEQLEGWGMDLPVFDYKEIDAEEDDYDVPDGGIETDIVIGDLFEIGDHRLLCGDSTDSDQVAKLMDGKKADLLLTDPPYGLGIDGQKESKSKNPKHNRKAHEFRDWDNERPDQSTFDFLLLQADKAIIWGGNYFADLLSASRGWIYWSKGQDGLTMSDGELAWTTEDKPLRCVTVNRAALQGSVHPTQKPIKVINFCIQYAGSPNLIIDAYLGSGSTMVASHQLNRKCFGMELDPKYCQVILNRMLKLDPTLTIKRNGIDETKKWLDEQV